MKNIVEFLNEGLQIINEDFSAEVLRTTFMDNPINKKFFKNNLARELKWDMISDNDSERVDVDTAAKAAYKKVNDTAYIIWLNSDDTIVARTIGITIIDSNIYANYHDVNCPNVRRVAKLSASAIIINNYLQFDTNELKKQRIEARRGALAFESNEKILERNLKKYNKMLLNRKIEKFNIEDYKAKLEDCGTKISEVIEKLTGDFTPEDWTYFNRSFQYLSRSFEDVMQSVSDLIEGKEEWNEIENKAKEKDWDEADYRQYIERSLGDKIERFNQVYSKFNSMYLAAINKEDLYKIW